MQGIGTSDESVVYFLLLAPSLHEQCGEKWEIIWSFADKFLLLQ